MTDHALTGPPARKLRAPGAGPSTGREHRGLAGLQAAAGNRAVSALLGGGGPALVQRLIKVTRVDYKPDVNEYVDWEVRTPELKEKLTPYLAERAVPVPPDNPVIADPTKRRTLAATLKAVTDTAPNLSAPDLPRLAPHVSDHIRGRQGLSTAEQDRLTTAVRSALTATSFTIKKSSGDAFESLLRNAGTTSQSKGTPNVIAVDQLPGPLQSPTTLIAGLVRARNVALVATGFQLPRFPLVTGLANKASIGMDSIRSTHTNMAGWLPASVPPLPMTFADLENSALAEAPPLLAAQLRAGTDLPPVSRYLVAALIFRALGGIPANRTRMALH